MKKLTILILIIAFAVGCKTQPNKNDGSTTSLVDYTEPPVIIVVTEPTTDSEPIVDATPDVVIEPAPDPTPDTPIVDPTPDVPPPDIGAPPPPIPAAPAFTVKIGDSLYFSDPDKMRLWKSGNIEKAGPGIYAVENDLFTMDASGNELSIIPLATPPIDAARTKIKSTQNGVYYCIEYPASLSGSLGGLYKVYSEIYKDNAVFSAWYLNRFSCKDVLSVDLPTGEEVFVLDTTGKYHTIDGASTTVDYVLDDVFYRHGLNISGKYMYFNNSLEMYNLNYALNASQWINYNGLNYSENGYTWTVETRLTENATSMHTWNIVPYPVTPELPNAQAPVLLSAGISAGKLYWIECNSGYVFEYDPILDSLTQKWKIYLGDGMKDTGILKRGTLQPYIHGGKLYFSNDGAIYKLGLADGFINIFYAGSGVVEGF